MLRAADAALLLAPLAILALYIMTARRGGPSRRAVAGLLALVVVCAAVLAWYALHERLPPGSRYVPAQLRDGQVVPGHGA